MSTNSMLTIHPLLSQAKVNDLRGQGKPSLSLGEASQGEITWVTWVFSLMDVVQLTLYCGRASVRKGMTRLL